MCAGVNCIVPRHTDVRFWSRTKAGAGLRHTAGRRNEVIRRSTYPEWQKRNPQSIRSERNTNKRGWRAIASEREREALGLRQIKITFGFIGFLRPSSSLHPFLFSTIKFDYVSLPQAYLETLCGSLPSCLWMEEKQRRRKIEKSGRRIHLNSHFLAIRGRRIVNRDDGEENFSSPQIISHLFAFSASLLYRTALKIFIAIVQSEELNWCLENSSI